MAADVQTPPPFQKQFKDITDRLIEDASFWESQTEGLLILASQDQFRLFHLPIDTSEYVAVAENVFLAPLFGLVSDWRDFYVLCVAQHTPKLYKGNFFGLEPVKVDLPGSIEEGLRIDEMRQKGEQQRSKRANRDGFNGRGGERNSQDIERLRFWRLIDKQIGHKVTTKFPLILAGIESEVAEFRQLSKYPKLLSMHIDGSFSEADVNDLLEPAKAIYKEEVIEPEHYAQAERFRLLHAKDQTATEIETVARAAAEGKIETVLLPAYRRTADTIRDNELETDVIIMPPEPLAAAINTLVIEAWQKNARIINLRESEMPLGGVPVLAMLRY